MRRAVASSMTWWVRAFVVSLLAEIVLDLPAWAFLLPPAFYAVSLVRRPPPQDPEPRWLSAPVRGRWVGLNSPADNVPSHGVRAYGRAYAIDILHPEPGDAPRSLGWRHGLREPETFSCFGEPVYAVAPGTVVRATDRLRDQRSRSSWPAVIWMLVVEGVLRELAAVGNTGNTSEPHLHVQLMDRARLTAAAGLPFRWRGIEIEPAEADVTGDRGDVREAVTEGLPGKGQVFTVDHACAETV